MTMGRRASRPRARASWMAVRVGLLALIVAGAARAQVPVTMNFQGLLLDAAGQPKNGTATFVFELYSAATGGSPLWAETLASVSVTDGVYDVILGATTALTPDVFSSATRYLQIAIDGEVLSPRRQLLVVPYAIRAEVANTANTAENASAADTASTASALAANGANCPAGQVSQGVDASGAVEGCIAPLQNVGGDTSPILGGNLDADGKLVSNLGGIDARTGLWTLNDTAQEDVAPTARAALRIRTTNEGGAAEFATGYGTNMGEFMVKYIGFDVDSSPTVEKLFGYINKAGHQYFRSSFTLSGVMNGPGGDGSYCEATLPSGSLNGCRIRPAEYGASGIPSGNSMLSVWSDVAGPGVLSRSNTVNPPSMPFMGMQSDGTPTFEVQATGEVGIWDGDSDFGTLDMANLSAARTYTFPDKDGDVLLKNGSWGTSHSIPMTGDANGNDVIDSGIRVDNTSPGTNYVALPSSTENASELRFYEDASHTGANYISLRAANDTRDISGNASYDITKFTRASAASASRGPVIGAIAISSSLDTAQKLCELQYDTAGTGVDANCLPGSAKEYDGTTAAPSWIGADYPNDNCTHTVTAGRYFEVVCTVED